MKKFLPLVFLFFAACSLPDLKSPELSKDETEVIEDVKKAGGFEEVALKWKFRRADGDYTHHLILKLKNPNPVPTSENGWIELGKDAFRATVVSVDNTGEYDFFDVEFEYILDSGVTEKREFRFTFDDLIQ